MGYFFLKCGISLVAVLMIILRLIFPQINIDGITIGLLVVAVLPWFYSLIESAKFPGGWEVRFRDLKDASKSIPMRPGEPLSRSFDLLDTAKNDANLALVYLRIEIEKRLRLLAEHYGMNTKLPLVVLFKQMRETTGLDHPFFDDLQQIVSAGNQAAHGASVEPMVADWAMEYGPIIIDGLDYMIEQCGMAAAVKK